MKRKTCTLYLSREEYGVILDALIRFKNKLTRQGRYTDIVDEVILALLSELRRIQHSPAARAVAVLGKHLVPFNNDRIPFSCLP